MITNFKIFESINKLPKEGDYVIISQWLGYGDKKLTKFYKEKIGKIINNKGGNRYDVEFDSDNPDLYFEQHMIELSGFEYWSENKEELEALMRSKKYNL